MMASEHLVVWMMIFITYGLANRDEVAIEFRFGMKVSFLLCYFHNFVHDFFAFVPYIPVERMYLC